MKNINNSIKKTIEINLNAERLLNSIASNLDKTRIEIEEISIKDELANRPFTSAMIIEDSGMEEFKRTLELAVEKAKTLFPEISPSHFDIVLNNKIKI